MNINKLDLFTKKFNTKKPTAPKKIRLRIFPLIEKKDEVIE